MNGDLFNYGDDSPSGMVMDGGALVSRPFSSCSSLAIGLDGLLHVGRVSFFGTWSIGGTKRQPLAQLNRPLDGNGASLFTSQYGKATPVLKGAVDVVVTGFPLVTINVDLPATVASVEQGGGTSIKPGTAVLQAVGPAAKNVLASAAKGVPFVARLGLKPWWDGISDAIGGGPALVQDGKVVLPTTESFSSTQIMPRAPRTAAGQLRDGRIVLLAVDGAQTWSAGVDSRELAEEMVRLGAVTAMALDSGARRRWRSTATS